LLGRVTILVTSNSFQTIIAHDVWNNFFIDVRISFTNPRPNLIVRWKCLNRDDVFITLFKRTFEMKENSRQTVLL
jgi:hypothetical protein